MPILTNILQKAKKESKSDLSQRKQKTPLRRYRPGFRRTPTKDTKEPAVQAKNKDGALSLQKEKSYGAYGVIVRPYLSEKALRHKDQGKYVFEVFPGATKQNIIHALQEAYGVQIEKVNRIKVQNRKVRIRRTNQVGTKVRYDKCVVTLKKGQSIEILPQ